MMMKMMNGGKGDADLINYLNCRWCWCCGCYPVVVVVEEKKTHQKKIKQSHFTILIT